jgi:hypothetical protein
MPRGMAELFQGVFVLFLALLLWRATQSFIGWAALFFPGAAYTLWGLYLVIRHR